ncbi:MAG: hypothetical protein ACRDPC_21440 [Solirubrobacteraceae bacterium]
MTGTVDFRPQTGTLVAPPPVFEALLTGKPDPELESAGAVRGDTAHPALQGALRAVAEPHAALVLERGDRRGYGWAGPEGVTALLLPLPDGRRRLITVRTQFVPDALARINDVAPRPRVEPAVRIRLSVPDLAAALAARDPAGAATDEPEAFASLLDSLSEHWRAEARWPPAEGSPGVRSVEVLDTTEGLWLVIPDAPSVELWPTTPTTVFRALCGLLPFDHEVRAP